MLSKTNYSELLRDSIRHFGRRGGGDLDGMPKLVNGHVMHSEKTAMKCVVSWYRCASEQKHLC